MHGSIPRAANRRHPGIAAHPPQRPAIQAIIYRRCSSRRGDAGVQTYFGMLQFSTKYTLPKNTKNSKRLDWNYVFSPIPVTYIVRRANTLVKPFCNSSCLRSTAYVRCTVPDVRDYARFAAAPLRSDGRAFSCFPNSWFASVIVWSAQPSWVSCQRSTTPGCRWTTCCFCGITTHKTLHSSGSCSRCVFVGWFLPRLLYVEDFPPCRRSLPVPL